MPTIIEGNIEALSKNGNNIFPITTPRAIIEEGSDRNLLDMLQDAARIPTAAEVGAASEEMISDAWVAGNAYAVGDYCIYNNTLWKCLAGNTGVTPATGTYWTDINIAHELRTAKKELSTLPYFLSFQVHATDTFKFKGLANITDNNSRQSVFVFGAIGGIPVFGMILFAYDYVSFNGNRTDIQVSIEASTRIVTVKLPGNTYDPFTLISALGLQRIT